MKKQETPMMKVAVRRGFKDGTIDFSLYGYGAAWFPGRWRLLPEDIVRRCEDSGAEICAPPVGAREDFIRIDQNRPENLPKQIPDEAKEETLREQFSTAPTVRVLFEKGYKNGVLRGEFAAIGRPPWIGVNEIVELPIPLYETLQRDGAKMSRDHDLLKEYEGQQLKHRRKVEAWQEEQKQSKTLVAESKANAAANAKTWEKINELSERVITLPPGKAREALWIRIEELHKRLK